MTEQDSHQSEDLSETVTADISVKKPKARGRGIYLLPNLLTSAALFSGFYAIIAAMNGSFEKAAIAIFVSMVLDGLDGRVARMTNTQSEFGAQYDSLADMVSFGVACLGRFFLVVTRCGQGGLGGCVCICCRCRIAPGTF